MLSAMIQTWIYNLSVQGWKSWRLHNSLISMHCPIKNEMPVKPPWYPHFWTLEIELTIRPQAWNTASHGQCTCILTLQWFISKDLFLTLQMEYGPKKITSGEILCKKAAGQNAFCIFRMGKQWHANEKYICISKTHVPDNQRCYSKCLWIKHL